MGIINSCILPVLNQIEKKKKYRSEKQSEIIIVNTFIIYYTDVVISSLESNYLLF